MLRLTAELNGESNMPDAARGPCLPPLVSIDDVEPFSATRDTQCIEEIRAVLERHGALKRFGVCLLHDHFPLDDDEVLVETVDLANRTLTIRPMTHSHLEQQPSIATNWRLDGSQMEGKIQCIQKCIPAGKDKHGKGHFTHVD